MQLPLALRKNQALLIQASRQRFQVKEFEHLLLVLGLDKSKDRAFDICRQVVLVTNDIRNKGITLHHLIAHVLEIDDIHTLVQASNRARDTVLMFLVAILLVKNNIASIDTPEMVRDAVAQVVTRNAYRDGFNGIAAHDSNEPVQRLMEIGAQGEPDIAHHRIRHENHHIVHRHAYEIDELFAIEQAHHGHEGIRDIHADIRIAHERQHHHKADKAPEHGPQAQREIAV